MRPWRDVRRQSRKDIMKEERKTRNSPQREKQAS